MVGLLPQCSTGLTGQPPTTNIALFKPAVPGGFLKNKCLSLPSSEYINTTDCEKLFVADSVGGTIRKYIF
jgi:hypothetical protein